MADGRCYMEGNYEDVVGFAMINVKTLVQVVKHAKGKMTKDAYQKLHGYVRGMIKRVSGGRLQARYHQVDSRSLTLVGTTRGGIVLGATAFSRSSWRSRACCMWFEIPSCATSTSTLIW